MSNGFVPMPDDERQAIRIRVIAWARLQSAIPELSENLREGPGGDGPDLIVSEAETDLRLMIYVTKAAGEAMPEPYQQWLNGVAASVGHGVFAALSVEGEDDARSLLLDGLPLCQMETAKGMH